MRLCVTGSAPVAALNPSTIQWIDRRYAGLPVLSQHRDSQRPTQAPAVKPSRENVVNLMGALRRSVAAERPAKSAAGAALRNRPREGAAGATAEPVDPTRP
jgi:hypothetical protein